MSQSSNTNEHVESLRDRPQLWGFFTGILVAALITVPLSASISLATHPETRFLLEGKGSSLSAFAYSSFWAVAALFLVALPFMAGFGVARLSSKTVKVIAAVVVVFLILLIVLGQLIF